MYYFEILTALYNNRIKYLLVGGLCVNLHGVPRFTQDIDIVLSMTPENILKTTKLLADLGYTPRLPVKAEDLADSNKVNDWIKNKNLKAFSFFHPKEQYKVVDILLTSPLDFDESYKNKVVKKVEDIEIYLASLEDLIKMKKLSGRPQDISDVEMLNEVKSYLEHEND